jgi:hypothetical protein
LFTEANTDRKFGAVFFAAESIFGARPALIISSALFSLAIVASAAFLSWMRRV